MAIVTSLASGELTALYSNWLSPGLFNARVSPFVAVPIGVYLLLLVLITLTKMPQSFPHDTISRQLYVIAHAMAGISTDSDTRKAVERSISYLRSFTENQQKRLEKQAITFANAIVVLKGTRELVCRSYNLAMTGNSAAISSASQNMASLASSIHTMATVNDPNLVTLVNTLNKNLAKISASPPKSTFRKAAGRVVSVFLNSPSLRLPVWLVVSSILGYVIGSSLFERGLAAATLLLVAIGFETYIKLRR